jgi:hypothetical protein
VLVCFSSFMVMVTADRRRCSKSTARGARIYTVEGGGGGAVRLLRGSCCASCTFVYVAVALYLDDCVRCIVKLIPGRWRGACIDLHLAC